ncbi:MAG: DUF1328 domain-containing protein [Chloroflexi bacterium]|nr:DUF1328 domain-containing protein [Chloroflexota bacterium]
MLQWAIVALVISLIAGALGFTGVAKGAAQAAKIFFAIFLVIALGLFLLLLLGVDLATSTALWLPALYSV